MLRRRRCASKCSPTEKTRSFRAFRRCEICVFLANSRQGCQRVQRLLKTFHRADAQPFGVLPRIACVLSRGDEKSVHTCCARADRFLLDSADRVHRPVRPDLARRRDLVTMVDVAAELLEDLECEREPRGWTADAVRSELHARLVEDDADDGAP